MTTEDVIQDVVGIKPGAGPVTPMDYLECKVCMERYAADCNKQEFQLPSSDGFFLRSEINSNLKSEKSVAKLGSILASIII